MSVAAERTSISRVPSAGTGIPHAAPHGVLEHDPAREAYGILRLAFVVAPVVAGLDKFFNLLTDWEKYLPPQVERLLAGHGHAFMHGVGVIEIAAGVGVALWPRFFAYVVAAWLAAIVVNLLMIPGAYDVALRDLGLALGALALARLSRRYGR